MTEQLRLSGNFIESILKLTRFGNLMIIGFTQYFTAAFLINNQTILDPRLLLLSISTILIAAAGYIINDYYDVKIDYINKPERVVIGKGIPRRFAILFHTLFSVMGVAIGMSLSWSITAVNLLSVFLLWLYSNNLKRLPLVGNLTVAILTGAAVYIIDLLYRTGSSIVIIYSVFALFITLVREIIKDIEDLKGDNTFGCKTLPIVLGIRKTKLIIYGIIVIFSISVVIINRFYQALPFDYYLVLLFIPLLILLLKLARADTRNDFSKLSTFCKVIMLLGILSMAFV